MTIVTTEVRLDDRDVCAMLNFLEALDKGLPLPW